MLESIPVRKRWQELSSRMGGPLFLAGFLVLHIFIVNNFLLLSTDMIRGDFSAGQISPAPRYPFFRVITADYQGLNRLGGDFAQVYFPSKDFSTLKNNYSRGVNDPWHRSSRYAPAVHYLCAITICRFDYGYAAFLHMLLQLVFFYISFYFAFRRLGQERYFLPALLLVNFCLFLTPVGITWFERGQFSLYVALAYLWLGVGLHARDGRFILLAAVFAFIKWTSLPYLFIILAINIIASKDRRGFTRAVLYAGIFAGIFLLFSAPFYNASKYFLAGLYKQELNLEPQGLSLMLLLPRVLVKALPVALIGLGWLAARRVENSPLLLAPFYAGAAMLLITYPTVAYDYSVPVLFAFIPLLLVWTRQPGLKGGRAGQIALLLFGLFLAAASFSRQPQSVTDDLPGVLLYALIGLALAAVPLFYPMKMEDSLT